MATDDNQEVRILKSSFLGSFFTKLFSMVGAHDPTPEASFEFDTAGGDEPRLGLTNMSLATTQDPDAFIAESVLRMGDWRMGLLDMCEQSPIHEGRIGGPIRFWGVTVHTTDMHPDRFGSLLRAWAKSKGRGAGAHFALGRTPAEGLHQLASVNRNGNHAGGPEHGWLLDGRKKIHPNSCMVGIEVSCAGRVWLVDGKWRTCSKVNGKRIPFGAPLPSAEVEQDRKHPDRGQHRPTDWQLYMLKRLLMELYTCPYRIAPPLGWGIAPNGDPPKNAPRIMYSPRQLESKVGRMPVVGHVTLDPNRKEDPHSILADFLNLLPI